MSDRTYTAPKPATNRSPRVVPTAAEQYISQEDERLRRARLAYADAAVAKTARRLTLDLRSEELHTVAQEHETNLLHRAEIRDRYGVATFTDIRILAVRDARNALDTAAVTR